MSAADAIEELKRELEARTAETLRLRRELEEAAGAVEAHEGLLKLAMEDMRRLYEDLLSTQSRLMQADKMATIGILSSSIAHEINNPLQYVESNLWLLKEALEAQPSSPEAARYASSALEGAERVRTIIHDIRSFSRGDQGEVSPQDLRKVLEEVIRLASFKLGKTKSLRAIYSEDLPPVVCSAPQMGQVFLNLIVNAIQAIADDGHIEVSTKVSGGKAAISIIDDGPGIPEEIRPRVFEPFFTTKEKGVGTGLGLSISAEIVKRHNGSIELESRPGRTAFTILLPIV